MNKSLTLLLTALFISVAAFAQTDESKLFPESIAPGDYLADTVRLPQSPFSMQILFIGGHDSVETRSGKALSKQWHDFIGFTPATPAEGGLGWVSVNHERIVADDKIGDGGGMTTFKVARDADGLLEILPQTLADGRSGKFFNVNFDNVGETGMNCAGITSLADGRIWTAEEWFRSSVSSIYAGGNGVRDTSDWIISGSGFPGFDGDTIKKVDNFNYMVEIDPRKSEAVRKQYNWGRGGWEGGVVMPDNKTAYLGEDARPGLFTRFVADVPGDFTKGTYSYYAYDEATEQGYWVDYPINTIEDAANLSASNGYDAGAKTFRGAPFVGDSAAAMFIRNEWVAAHDGKVYWAETGNDGFWNEFTDYRLHKSSPVAIADYNGNNYNGKIGSWLLDAARLRFPALNAVSNDSVREWLTADQNFRDAHGRILCYDPATSQTTLFLEGGPYPGDANGTSLAVDGGYPEKHLSNPDGLNFLTTPQGKTYMIICEDLNGRSYNRVPAGAQSNSTCELWALDMDVPYPSINDLIRITQVPLGAEVTGAQQTPDGISLLVNSQHPRSTNPFPFNNSLTFAIHGWDKLAELEERRVSMLQLADKNDPFTRPFINYGDTIELDDLNTGLVRGTTRPRNFQLKVVMEPQIIQGSMNIDIQGPVSSSRVENYFRYLAPFPTNAAGEYVPGTYTVTITPYSDRNLSGNEGVARTFVFTLKESGTPLRQAAPTAGDESQISVEEGFRVFPNPTINALNFNTKTSVAIYNELGQRVAVFRDVTTVYVDDFRTKLAGKNVFFVQPENGKAVKVVLDQN
ncbi:MAG: alkaline phosphatase PhoX [Bacteroidota bacterium]